jgi:hypothetical protein
VPVLINFSQIFFLSFLLLQLMGNCWSGKEGSVWLSIRDVNQNNAK